MQSLARATFAIVVALGLLVGCSGSRQVTKASYVAPEPTTISGWHRDLLRRVRTKQDAAAIKAAGALRKRGALTQVAMAYEAIALRRLGRQGAARQATLRVVQAAARQPKGDWRGLELLVAWYTSAHPTEIWEHLRPLRTSGCQGPQACDLLARVLIHGRALTGQPLRAALDAARPRASSAAASKWQASLIRGLVLARDWPRVDIVIADTIRRWTTEPEGWAAWMYAARRRRGLQHRRKWIAAIAGAKLSADVLRRIAAREQVEADALIVERLWRMILKQKGAVESDRIAYIRLLTKNQQRGLSSIRKDEFRRLAQNFGGGTAERLVLVEGLLVASLTNVAQGLLDNAENSPQVMVLRAEIARQLGDLTKARALASQAHQQAKDKHVVAAQLARIWRPHLVTDAAQWQRQAEKAGGRPTLSTASVRALRLLLSHRPAAGAEQVLVQYARQLNGAMREGPTAQAEAKRHRRRLLTAIGSRIGRSRWRTPLRAVLTALASSDRAGAPTLYLLARVNYRSGRPDAGLAAWKRASEAALSSGAHLNHAQLLNDLVARSSTRPLLAWLAYTKGARVGDAALSWRIAQRLLRSRDKIAGRRWVVRALSLMDGGTALLERLPGLDEPRRNKRHRPMVLSASDLRRLVSRGAADLLVSYLHERRASTDNDPRATIKYGIAESSALAQLGRDDEARKMVRQLAALGRLRSSDRRDLLNLAWRHGMCRLVLDLSKRFIARRDSRTYKLAVSRGVACARRLGDRPAAFELAKQVERKRIRLSSQLLMAKTLAEHGFDRLAIHFFERKFRNAPRRASLNYYYAWAGALLALGRVDDAVHVLNRFIRIYRRNAGMWRSSAQLLERHGYLTQAIALLERGIAVHQKDLAMRLALVQHLLRLDDQERIQPAVAAFVRLGPAALHWRSLVETATSQDRLAVLHDALTQLMDKDRQLERVRIQVAAQVGDRRAVLAAIGRLRAKGPVADRAVLAALRRVGAERQARAVAQDLLTQQQPQRRSFANQTHAQDMLAALAVRRDPSSKREALALARLHVGRSLEPGASARASSVALAHHGYLREASALGSLALNEGADDELLMCEQGQIQFVRGDRAKAMALWQRAVAATLTHPRIGRRFGSRSSSRRTPPGIKCLVRVAESAGEYAALKGWLANWRDVLPQVTALWKWSIRLEVSAGNLDHAVRLLRAAERRSANWSDSDFGLVARLLLARGAGPLLLKSFEREPPRTESWWLAFAARTALRHRQPGDPAAAQLLNNIELIARNVPEARAWLALEWVNQGQPQRALTILGQAPLSLMPHLVAHARWSIRIRRHSQRFPPSVRRAWRKLTPPRPKDPAARSCAATLIAVARSHPSEDKSLLAPSPMGVRQAVAVARKWLRSGGAQAAIRLAHELTLQGHAGLAAEVVKLSPKGGRLPLALEELRFRVIAATGSDTDLVAAAKRAAVGTERRFRSTPADMGPVVQRIVDLLIAWGRPSGARALLASYPEWVRGRRRSGILSDTALGRSLQLNARGVTPRPADDGANYATMAQVTVALAAGNPRAAETKALALARQTDTPWRVWVAASKSAFQHREWPSGRSFLAHAKRAGAPTGALACLALRGGSSSDVSACTAGRPLASLDDWELVCFAAGLGRAGRISAAIRRDIHLQQLDGRLRLLAALAAARSELSGPGREFIRTVGMQLVQRAPKGKRRRQLVNAGLDDLAVLGVIEPGVSVAQAAFDIEPHGQGKRNNLGYARLLAGQAPATIVPFVAKDLGHLMGNSAEAIFDTLATGLMAMGRRTEAMRLQRYSLVSSPSSGSFSQLPMVRHAAFLADAGRCPDAIIMALGALRRADDGPARDGVSGDGTRSSTHAHRIGIQWRARAVVRRCLRAKPKVVAPTTKSR
ncbi:MAG: hypothetical protein KC502_20375 [Myxococcales bacterium]|nr:hypothetical protein [Myxococcales bacterium]